MSEPGSQSVEKTVAKHTRDFDESADWRNAFEQAAYSADREAYRQCVARVRSELETAARE